MSFAKLDSGIVNSTIWVQPADVLKVWIWFLSQADADGFVRVAAPALAHACMVPLDRMREILALLEAPDPDSRTAAEEGRRIEKIEGGWGIVNYRAYRERVSAEDKREADRLRIAAKRAAEKEEKSQGVAGSREASESVAEVAQAEAEEDISEAKASGAVAPNEADPIWHTGLAFLRRKGIPEQAARKFLGKLKREAGDIDAAALLAQAEAQDITEPIPWLTSGAVAARERGRQRGASPVGKQVQGLMALEGMKSGNRMAAGRVGDGVPEALLLGTGTHAGG